MFKLSGKVMKKEIKDITILDLLFLTQSELRSLLLAKLPADHTTREEGAIIVTPPRRSGTVFRPMLCSHMDTVSHTPPKPWAVQNVNDTIFLSKWAKSSCLGGDDRAGVYIMLQMIASEHYDRYTYGFFEDEERGCLGSTAYSYTESFDKLCTTTSIFIGIDRQCTPGKPEIAQYGYDSDDVDDVLDELLPEYALEIGSMSDCSTLSEFSAQDIPCINITAGYIHEHSARETIHVPSMMKTLEDLKGLEFPDKPFEYEYEPANSWYGGVGWGSRSFGYGGGNTKAGNNKSASRWNRDEEVDGVAPAILCDQCGAHTLLYEDPMLLGYLCRECLDPNILTIDDFVDYTEEDN